MKHLVLINPVGRKSGFILSSISRFPPLGLAYVAAVTPEDWDVKIIDENFDTWMYEEADLVGITAFTSSVGRAYEIATEYRNRGIPVVMGGIHASMVPDEALQYVDAVVAGEVEGIWATVLEDFHAGKMTGLYRGPQVDLQTSEILPRRDLLHPGYFWQPVQTSRGCPFDCSFCSVSRYLGRQYRQRTAESVLRELESLKGKYVLFLDDNLIGYSPEARTRALTIFDGMISRKMNKKWWMQSSINFADDDLVLSKASKSGCSHVFIGFETTDKDSLENLHKGINLKNGVVGYDEVVRRLHAHGIGVMGSFIIGTDNEKPDYYKKLVDFILRANVDIVQISMLTPLPGTALMDEVLKDGRLVFDNYPADWAKYRFSYLVHRPVGVDVAQVYTGNNFIKKSIYSFPVFQWRLLRIFISLKRPLGAYIIYKLNKALRLSWMKAHYRWTYPDRISEE
jgi:radical SAM superfamily enzyme YgiQ (UPF0313 family)